MGVGFYSFIQIELDFADKLQTALNIWILRVEDFSLEVSKIHTHAFVTYFSAKVNTFCFDVRSKFKSHFKLTYILRIEI